MDFIRKYDIELEKEHYYAGETLRGRVVIENIENLRVTGVQLFLRGKAHVEWRITRGGERRTVKEDQYFIDEKLIVWGSDVVDDVSISILPRGDHRFPFEFQLPVTCLPCSFESRIGTVRYYLRVIIDIPYASPPQGLKYFTVIGPYIDCMDNRYTTAVSAVKQTTNKCLCCVSGPINVEASLEQTAYCCGENIRIKCEVQNGSDQEVTLFCRLIQLVEFRINKGAFGLSKDVSHTALELRCPPIAPHSTHIYHDLSADLEVPVMPPTMVEVCKVIEINYVLRVGLHLEKSSDDLQMDFPFVVATVPHPFVTGHLPEPSYEPADDHVEGGIYVSPEFQLGQVYDGGVAADDMEEEEVILYRPVYICVGRHSRRAVSAAARLSNGHSPSSQVVTASDYPTAFADTGGCCSEPVSTDRPKAIRSSNTRQQLPSASPAAAAKAASSSSHLPAAARNGAESVERRRPMQTTAAAALKDIAMEVEDENSSSRWKAMPAEAWQAKSNELSRTVKECHSKQPESRSQEGRTRELPEREVGTMDDHRRNSSKDATAAVGMQRINSDLTKPNSVQQQQQHQQQQQRQQQRGYHHCYGTSTIALSHQSPAETRQPQPTQIGGMEGIRGREKEERKDGGRDGAKGGSEGGERKGRVMEEQGGEGKMVSTKEKYTRKEIPSSSPSSSSPPVSKSVAASKPSPSDKQREQQQPQMPGATAAVSAVKSELTIRREWEVEGSKSKPGYDVRTSAINKQANAKIMTHTLTHDDNGNTGRYGDDGDVIGRSLMKTSLVEKCAENCRNASVEPELLPPNTRKVEKVAATGEKDVRVLRGENQKRGDAQLQSYQNYSDTRNERSERTGIGGVQSVNPTITSSGTFTSSPSVTTSVNPTFTSVGTFASFPSITTSFNTTFTSSGTFTSSPSVTTSVNSTFTSAGTFTSSPSVTASVNPTVTPAGTFSSSTSITTSVNPTFTSAGTFTSIPSVTASVNPMCTGKVTVSDSATDTPS